MCGCVTAVSLFFFKQNTAYEMRISDWSSDVCSSDLTDINNRDRYFLRGQLLFEPTDALSVRLIADYTFRDERCCAAIYVDNSVNPYIGGLNNPSSLPYPPGTPIGDNENSIIQVLTDIGQDPSAFSPGYSRDISFTPGPTYTGTTKDRTTATEGTRVAGSV